MANLMSRQGLESHAASYAGLGTLDADGLNGGRAHYAIDWQPISGGALPPTRNGGGAKDNREDQEHDY
jgi:hypothetical protein